MRLSLSFFASSTAAAHGSSARTRRTSLVSLSPTATEILFAIGAGDQVEAVDQYSYFPADAPVTDLSGFDPNVEASRVQLSEALPQTLAALDLQLELDIVDMAEGFDPATMLLGDGLHPNGIGDAHLAARWHAAWPD